MNLVIVESPAKAKTLVKYLGSGYQVLASMGHVRDLVKKGDAVDVEHNFEMKYQRTTNAAKSIGPILTASKKADKIFLASDPDREGEAIAWHIKELILEGKSNKEENIKRASFSEITSKAVKNAIDHPRDIDINLVDAQQARRAIDYLVGFNISPVLWHKLPTAKSAGRVQSVALRLIAEREAEIKIFIPKEYWSAKLMLSMEGTKVILEAKVTTYNGKKFSTDFPQDKDTATEIQKAIIDSGVCTVSEVTDKDFKQNPYPPFITSTLQQEALKKLRFDSSRTMKIAQKLYEGIDTGKETVGLITYMRTDGTSITDDAVTKIRESIEAHFGKNYLPPKVVQYKTKVKNAQEAHEAIRVTNPLITPEEASKFLDADSLKLYSLIWKRTIACQMLPAIKTTHSVRFKVNNVNAEAIISTTSIKFNGFLAVYNYKNQVEDGTETQDEESEIPPIKEGQIFNIKNVPIAQHFTLPPPRYNEASLIKTMEELGVGRPSTYATIISVIQNREYVKLEKMQFHATPIGMIVTAFLKRFFPKYVQYDFTAKLEQELDEISTGHMMRIPFLQEFWKPFKDAVDRNLKVENLEVNKQLGEELASYIFAPDNTNQGKYIKTCPKCGKGEMEFKTGKFGPYIRCSTYPECQNTVSIGKGDRTEPSETHTSSDGNFTYTLKSGQFGKYLEVVYGDGTKKRNITIPKDIKDPDDATLAQLAQLPRNLGINPVTNKEVIVNVGRFGPYAGNDNNFASIKTAQLFTIELQEAVDLINKKSSITKTRQKK